MMREIASLAENRSLATTQSLIMGKEYFVYIITNRYNTVLYTGVTGDLERRVWEHKQGLSSFTASYRQYHRQITGLEPVVKPGE